MDSAPSVPAASVSRRRHALWTAVLVLAVASVGASLTMRVVHRGSYLPGWDYLLTVQSEYLLATRGVVGALHEILVKVRTFWLPPAAYSIPYGLVPAALSAWWPSLFWQPAMVFLAWVGTLACLLVATGWRVASPRGWAIALLCWGASPALLSYAVEGYPWGGGMLPHALVLAMALSSRPWRWWTTLLALLVIWELPWHGYELSKTVGITLLLCAMFAPRAGMARRLVWALVAGTSIWAVWRIWPSHNMLALGQGNVGTGVGLFHAVGLLPAGAAVLVRAMAGWNPLILPVLAVSGLLALPWTGIRRNALAACWVVQLALIVLLCAAGNGEDLLRPRRFQALDVMSIAALLAAMRNAPALLRAGLVGMLLAGNAWTLANGAQFVRTPFTGNPFSLPGVVSIEGVGTIDPPSIEWAKRLERRARAGERVVVLHGQMCPMENVTNPVAVLERLYVRLGHETFRARVLGVPMADELAARYVTVPVVDVRTAIDTLVPGTIVEVDTTCVDAMADVRQQLAARFTLAPVEPEDPRILRYRLDPLPAVPARS